MLQGAGVAAVSADEGSIEDPIEELAEVLVTIFECEDALRLLTKALRATELGPVKIRLRKGVVEWMMHLSAAHNDLEDLIVFPRLSDYLSRTRNYR